MRIVIAGAVGGSNVGESFHRAARELGYDCTIVDTKISDKGSRIWRSLNWRVLDHRPCNIGGYNRILLSTLQAKQANFLLTTGIAPVSAATLQFANRNSILTVNFSTDDPWNPALRSNRFLRTIPMYDSIFTPRQQNTTDFSTAGAKVVCKLPFGYDPTLAYPVKVPKSNEFDILFVGGGDHDRAKLVRMLMANSIRIRIAGEFWPGDLQKFVVGHLTPAEICRLTSESPICLVLPRRANRDGHTMRSYEVAAIGGTVIAEDSEDHRDLYGDAAMYFRTPSELVSRVRELVGNLQKRSMLCGRLSTRMSQRNETYSSRLRSMLEVLSDSMNSEQSEPKCLAAQRLYE